MPLTGTWHHVMLRIVAGAEIDEGDLMSSYSKTIMLIKLALLSDLVHLLTHGPDPMPPKERHFDGFLVADVSLADIGHDQYPRVAAFANLIDRFFVVTHRLRELVNKIIELGVLILMEGQIVHLRVVLDGILPRVTAT